MHVAITAVTDSRSDLAPIKLCGSSGIDFTWARQQVQMQLTTSDVCHPCTFSSIYVNASNIYHVAFDIRRTFWTNLKSSLKMGEYLWHSNFLFLIQLHVKISVNVLFVEYKHQAEYSPNYKWIPSLCFLHYCSVLCFSIFHLFDKIISLF